jgi:hypothetical protein
MTQRRIAVGTTLVLGCMGFYGAFACAASSGSVDDLPGTVGVGTGTGGTASGSAGAGATPPQTGASGTAGTFTVPTQRPVGGSTDGGACKAVVQQAEKLSGGRADIIFALDNSGSMTEEALAVQNNMNTFSNQIAASGIDAHVVVISSGPPGGKAAPCTNFLDPACWIALATGWGDSNGVCVEPPLGAQGACPAGDDTNLPNYMHWRVEVGSHDALAVIQSSFNGWQAMLRPDAAKTFVVVTDDENEPAPTGPDFASWVNGQPLFQSAVWRFSGIYCVTMSGNCAGQGATYQALVGQTGGISGDMALFSSGQVDAQFKTVFDTLAKAIVQDAVPVDCEWLIPPPPDGEALDPNAVNVHFTGSSGQTQVIYGVNAPSDCTDQYGGWYYDDPAHPTRVVACPQSCQVMQADLSARVEVLFGCAREVPPVH